MGRNETREAKWNEKITAAMQDGREQRGPFKKKRANQVLTRGEVTAIKIGRKKLRREMKERGIKKRKDFELTASSLGLYFDQNRFWGLLLWLFHGRGLWALLGALATLLLVLYLFSRVTQLQGHFTINMSDDMFREGFSLCETEDFGDPRTRLYCDPALDVPCFSITDILTNVDQVDGQHNEAQYFAYTYYIRNEGESTVGYDWTLQINSESSSLSEAVWVMVFEDGQMCLYAKANELGMAEALPSMDDNTRGYLRAPFLEVAKAPEKQFQVVATRGDASFYRVIPYPFLSDLVITSGTMTEVEPWEIHKYTVVIWLEGDDPDCTDDLIGGHLGMDMSFALITEEVEAPKEEGLLQRNWKTLWEELMEGE